MPIPELKLIERIRGMSGKLSPGAGRGVVIRGIGDDCAVLRLGAGSDTLVTTDLCIEGVHFRKDWYPPSFIGRQCLTRGLSDVAAMGGVPVAAFLSLALPAKLPQAWADAFLTGLIQLAGEHKVVLAGGDVSSSHEGVVADIMVVGRVPAGKAILRFGAKPGDALYVTGMLGVAAARVAAFRAGKKREAASVQAAPRVAIGRKLL